MRPSGNAQVPNSMPQASVLPSYGASAMPPFSYQSAVQGNVSPEKT